MRKTVRGAFIKVAMATVIRSAGTQRLSNAWPTGSEKAGPVDPVRTRPRRNHLRQRGPGGAKRLTACATSDNFALFSAIRRATCNNAQEKACEICGYVIESSARFYI